MRFIWAISVLTCTLELYGQHTSRVKTFQYGGLGDNINGTFYGYIYYPAKTTDNSYTLQPLANVIIKAFDKTGKTIKILTTNKEGFFLFELPNGSYNFSILKNLYQTLDLTNYSSNADQVSLAEIILEKGASRQSYKIPQWTDFSPQLYTQDSIHNYR